MIDFFFGLVFHRVAFFFQLRYSRCFVFFVCLFLFEALTLVLCDAQVAGPGTG